MNEPPTAVPVEVIDRADPPRSFLNTGWPLLALSLMLLMLVRACVPAAAPPPTAPVFDAGEAARGANAEALAALGALPAQPALSDALAALNRLVINFDTGSAAIDGEADRLLRQAAAVLARLPEATRLVITGHTDNVGDPLANEALSLRRAEAVRDALVGHGVPATMLAAAGAGASQPIAGNDDEAGRFRNRRIEFSAAP